MFNMVYRGGRIRGGEGNASIWWKDLNVVKEGRPGGGLARVYGLMTILID
jgi:hypothetical protein